jgi:HEAT repeat protein
MVEDQEPRQEGQRRLPRIDIIKAARLYKVESGVTAVYWSLTGGVFLTGFFLHLGAKELVIGLLSIIPPLLMLLQPFITYWVDEHTERRRFVLPTYGVNKTTWWLVIALAFFLPDRALLVALLAAMAVWQLAGISYGPQFSAWFSDVIPPDHRGRTYGGMLTYSTAVALCVSIPASRLVDIVSSRTGFVSVFSFGAVFGLLGLVTLSKIPNIPRLTPSERQRIAARISEPFRDARYRRLIWYFIAWTLASGMFGQFPILFLRHTLKMSYTLMNLHVTVIPGVVGLLSYSTVGWLVDKFGNRPLTAIAVASLITWPILWLISPWGGQAYQNAAIGLAQLTAGAASAILSITHFNMMISFAPDDKRSQYLAGTSAILGIFGAASPFVGTMLMTTLRSVSIPIGGLGTIRNFQILCLTTLPFRFLALGRLLRIREERDMPAGYVLDQVATPKAIPGVVQMRKLRASDETSRAEAAKALGRMKSGLAVEELTAALEDSSPKVRKEAAAALGEIGDKRAVPGLVKSLAEGDRATRARAASALARIADASSVPHLLGLLSGEDAVVCALALDALGAIGDPGSAPDILERVRAWAREGEPDLAAAGLEILSDMSYEPSCDVAEELLGSRDADLRAAAAAACGRFGHVDSATKLRSMVAQDPSPSVRAAAATSLAGLGDTGSAAAIASLIDPSLPKRVRIEAGEAAAKLLGAEKEYDRLTAAKPDAAEARAKRLLGDLYEVIVPKKAAGMATREAQREKTRAAQDALAGEEKAKLLGMLLGIARSPRLAESIPIERVAAIRESVAALSRSGKDEDIAEEAPLLAVAVVASLLPSSPRDH